MAGNGDKKKKKPGIRILQDFSGHRGYCIGEVIEEADDQYSFFEEQANLGVVTGNPAKPLCVILTPDFLKQEKIELKEKEEAEAEALAEQKKLSKKQEKDLAKNKKPEEPVDPENKASKGGKK